MYGELKNALPLSVQRTYLPVRGHKVPGFKGSNIGPRMEICGILCLPIPMVPRLYPSNAYIKRKLCVWRAEKCIPLIGAENVLTTAGPQSIPFHGGQ